MSFILAMPCKLDLKSELSVGQYNFHANGYVSATIGEKDGWITAPLYQYKLLSENSLEIFNVDGCVELWSNIKVESNIVHVQRNGIWICLSFSLKDKD